MPQNLSAQLVYPSPKALDFNEKRLHWASVVRAYYLQISEYPSFSVPLICRPLIKYCWLRLFLKFDLGKAIWFTDTNSAAIRFFGHKSMDNHCSITKFSCWQKIQMTAKFLKDFNLNYEWKLDDFINCPLLLEHQLRQTWHFE